MSKVFYIRITEKESAGTLAEKAITLLNKLPTLSKIQKDDFVAVKTHFGEKDNIGHISPDIISHIAQFLSQKSNRVFVTDTNVLYLSGRSNSIDHIRLADRHGFNLSAIGVPVIIADGLRGRNHIEVEVKGRHCSRVKIASDIASSDFMVCLSHMTGHMQTGFGATIKNLGMGCAARAGKREQHENVLPSIAVERCRSCGTCVKWCPENAVRIEGKHAVIAADKCVGCGECVVACKYGAIEVKWSEDIRTMQEKMAEYALGVVNAIGANRVCFINFLMHITKDCDCMAKDEPPICNDVGIMASCDPVALDAASVDILNEIYGKDVFKIGYPDIDWSFQLKHAQDIGLGSAAYERVEI